MTLNIPSKVRFLNNNKISLSAVQYVLHSAALVMHGLWLCSREHTNEEEDLELHLKYIVFKLKYCHVI